MVARGNFYPVSIERGRDHRWGFNSFRTNTEISNAIMINHCGRRREYCRKKFAGHRSIPISRDGVAVVDNGGTMRNEVSGPGLLASPGVVIILKQIRLHSNSAKGFQHSPQSTQKGLLQVACWWKIIIRIDSGVLG